MVTYNITWINQEKLQIIVESKKGSLQKQDQKSIDAIGSVSRFSTTSRHCKANNSWKNQHTEQLYVIYIYVIYVWHMI